MRHAPQTGIVLVFLAFGSQLPRLVRPTRTPEDVRFFETRIRPLLAEQCFKCHGPEKQKGDLRLDSAEAIKKGGDVRPRSSSPASRTRAC